MKRLFFKYFILPCFLILNYGLLPEKLEAQLIRPYSDSAGTVLPAFLLSDTAWVESIMKELDLDEKIGQFMMVAAYMNEDKSHEKEIEELVRKYHIGGLIFFQGGPLRQVKLVNRYQKEAKIPLLIAMDAEWGLGMRLDSTIAYPRQMMLGAIRDDSLIYRMGFDIGNQLKRLGVHVNLAPVADVNNNPENPVINFRSFGEDPVNVALKAESYFHGMEDAGIISTAKHFPGHGDTNADSHYTLPVIMQSRPRLDSIELFTFKYLIDKGMPAIMSAHLNIPALDSTKNLASSLSPLIIDSLLKKTFNFTGLVFTDALNMKGVTMFSKPGETEQTAFLAGNDILLMPSDVPKAISGIKRDVRRGIISEEEIDKRCRKILFAKAWAELNNYQSVKTDSLLEDLNKEEYIALQRKLIANSLTIIKNSEQALPVFNLENNEIASVTIGNGTDDNFSETLKLYSETDAFYISRLATYPEFDSLSTKLISYNTLIVSIQETSSRPTARYGITQNTIRFIQELRSDGNIILIIFGNPYSVSFFDSLSNIDAIVVAYDNDPQTREIAAQLIFGAIPARGVLPVSIRQDFTAKSSVELEKIDRLSYGIPEEEGLDSEILSQIDSLAIKAIREKATPGCQVLVARNSKVLYNKAFGYHTYRNNIKNKTDDLYDLASITKITATIPVLMKLSDEGKFDVTKTLSYYLPELDTTNKANLRIDEILTHQAGLQPWIPFYYKTIEPLDTSEALLSTKLSDNYPYKLGINTYVNRNTQYVDGVFSTKYSSNYPICVAKDLYLRRDFRDTIYQNIITSPLLDKKEYKYSDLGYYFFQRIIENITGIPLYPYLFENFYSRMGTTTLGFLPLNRFPEIRIIPTENDQLFRRQIITGYVHDPGAAMLGGVAGHAGLFSSANDLAKMMQMYLNKGTYGGRIFFSDTMINKFTSRTFLYNGNRRGLGFDKPEPDPNKISPASPSASSLSFGHSGFTGTLVWVDPQYNLIYIFLSNRIHPDQFNSKLVDMDFRTQIQEVVYKAIRKCKNVRM